MSLIVECEKNTRHITIPPYHTVPHHVTPHQHRQQNATHTKQGKALGTKLEDISHHTTMACHPCPTLHVHHHIILPCHASSHHTTPYHTTLYIYIMSYNANHTIPIDESQKKKIEKSLLDLDNKFRFDNIN